MGFRFVVRPHAAFDAQALRRFSEEQDFPLVAVDVAAADSSSGQPDRAPAVPGHP